jgi:hypothetical protein
MTGGPWAAPHAQVIGSISIDSSVVAVAYRK